MEAGDKLSDYEVVSLLRQGDHNAYAIIYERYFGLLYIYARRKVGNLEDAKDLVQETFIAFWNRREAIDPERNIAPYLYSALRNKIIDWIAHQEVNSRYITSFKMFLENSICVTDHLVREKQLIELIEKEIHALPPRMREIFELSRKNHLTHREIADKLFLSEQTVKTQVKKALKILRMRLGILVYLYLIFRF